jgi:hypothetical protein
MTIDYEAELLKRNQQIAELLKRNQEMAEEIDETGWREWVFSPVTLGRFQA